MGLTGRFSGGPDHAMAKGSTWAATRHLPGFASARAGQIAERIIVELGSKLLSEKLPACSWGP